MTDIIHGSSRAVPVDNPFFRWWQSVDQWTLVATLGLIVMGLLLSMAASVPLADSNDMPAFYYVYRQAIYGMISFSLIIFLSTTSLSVVRRFGIIGFFFSSYCTCTSSHFWYGFRERGSAMVLFKLVNNSAV